jgi:hypothetical protein
LIAGEAHDLASQWPDMSGAVPIQSHDFVGIKIGEDERGVRVFRFSRKRK